MHGKVIDWEFQSSTYTRKHITSKIYNMGIAVRRYYEIYYVTQFFFELTNVYIKQLPISSKSLTYKKNKGKIIFFNN